MQTHLDLHCLPKYLFVGIQNKTVLNLHMAYYGCNSYSVNKVYYIPINDTTLELSVFWPSDTESRIKELRVSESISLSF